MKPPARERIVAAVAGWFQDEHPDWKPRVLDNQRTESAVAVARMWSASSPA